MEYHSCATVYIMGVAGVCGICLCLHCSVAAWNTTAMLWYISG